MVAAFLRDVVNSNTARAHGSTLRTLITELLRARRSVAE